MLSENFDYFRFEKTEVKTILLESIKLQGNIYKDRTSRSNPVIIPRQMGSNNSVVYVLAGYGGNSPNYFSPKPFSQNAVEVLCKAIDRGEAPLAIYVFVDAMTFWGGSQFVNSDALGNYEDYIIAELVPETKKLFATSLDPSCWCVTGGSSGGYGALHLGSRYPDIFGVIAAIAPDCFFEMSLLPELMAVKPTVDKMGGIDCVRRELENGKLLRRKDAHKILNAIAMGLCYSGNTKGEFVWPFDDKGELVADEWRKWKERDPVNFLRARRELMKQNHRIFLEVGREDQYYLQYGARRIRSLLEELNLGCYYNEFNGSHFDIGDRRIEVWRWLNDIWIAK